MREAKFKAWDKIQQRWYKGTIEVSYTSPTEFCFVQGDRFEIVEFTGLKDKNGRDIYEGDIVSMPCGEPAGTPPPVFAVVYTGVWEYAAFALQRPSQQHERGYTYDLLNPQYAKDCIVIGNVRENPELLDKGAGT